MGNDGYNSYGPHDLLEYSRNTREGREDHACKNCGQMLAENAQRCPICGTPVIREGSYTEGKNRNSKVVISLAVLLCLVTILMIYFAVEKKREKSEFEDKYNKINSELYESRKSYTVLEATLNDLKTSDNVLQGDYNSLKKDYDSLKKDYEDLINDSRGWYQLSDTDKEAWIEWSENEKAAEVARAETDRINAEKELQKLKEEEERKEAEEKAKQEAEEKKGYETGYTYTDLARRPDDYIGKKVKFKGEVLQVLESSWSDEIDIRLATKKNSWGGYSDDVIYIHFNKSLISERILEEDIITIYGVAEPLKSYTSIFGSTITLPMVKVDKIELNK